MLAKTPPMGWNSWNTFGTNISETLIMEIADTMMEKGYKDVGYEYVVIDDGWSDMNRDMNGNLVADPEKFPHGIKYLADYIHSKGLKFGIYSCAGIKTCGGYPGSGGHEYEDAQVFAEWGVDFLKYDFCYFPESGDAKNAYLTMSMALKASGREILFSACNWGVGEPWKWMRSIGVHMYRSTGDIFDSYKSYTIKSIFYDGYNNTKVFAYMEIPETTTGEKVPAVVCVHGGGGKAYIDWVKRWNEEGVAAIAMDMYE